MFSIKRSIQPLWRTSLNSIVSKPLRNLYHTRAVNVKPIISSSIISRLNNTYSLSSNSIPHFTPTVFARFKSDSNKNNTNNQGGGDNSPNLGDWWNGLSTTQKLLFAAGVMMILTTLTSGAFTEEIDYQTFRNKLLPSGAVQKIVVKENRVTVYLKDGYNVSELIGKPVDQSPSGGHGKIVEFGIGDLKVFLEQLTAAQEELGKNFMERIPVDYETSSLPTFMLVVYVSASLFLIFYLNSMMRSGGPGGGGERGIFQFGKTFAQVKSDVKVTFADVAGMEEAKNEIVEFVSFLKNPKKYEKLGAKIPKGALLVGAPGTGKTLLAKATAGEAKVPFYSISGSDFVELFVGVGPARVRDLFEQARANAPSIVFIDEIDAVGRARSSGPGHHDERENTLNQLLVEMDGFNPHLGVVVLAGTNRPDILDKALLRPGRFDRKIYLERPDIKERVEILRVHLKPLKLADEIEATARKLAPLTPGFTGADLANLCNEAALMAARSNHANVTYDDFEKAIDRVIAGLEKKNRILSPDEKNIVAHHEAGHAIVGWFLEHTDPLLKVSIIPRGSGALGYAQYQPKDQYLYTRDQLFHRMMMILGGRIAESLIFGKISTGAQDDLEKVTKIAYSTVAEYGMNERVGTLSFPIPDENDYVFRKPYSNATARMIDEEVKNLVQEAYKATETLLKEKIADLKAVAQVLLKKEVLSRDDLASVLGKRPFKEQFTYEEIVNYEKEMGKQSSPQTVSSSNIPN
eukprot:TRINITY_DN1111_c0_g1_i2.p1 TRINITY_DN1111_c0_g1~~TRINITY_DN1111_c0_g1_i2.p1  ORF type:complete len:746 (+),score=173.37 TRINITY_DN1111_c0_g1_i2:230-2467(+)